MAGKVMTEVASRKAMMFGEGGLALFFTLTAFLSIVAAAKAEDAPFAFHAYLAAAASIAALIAILSSYQDRPADLPPQQINGKPNYPQAGKKHPARRRERVGGESGEPSKLHVRLLAAIFVGDDTAGI
jgi:hypothetical protein